MLRYGAVVVLMLAGLAVLDAGLAWIYIATSIVFEAWLRHRIAVLEREPVQAEEPPWNFSADEALLVGRYPFYFHSPVTARACASVLAAVGITSMMLALWLTYRQAIVEAVLIGANLFAVARLTKRVAPVLALHQSASRGNREAQRLLDAHDPAWAKIRAANAAATTAQASD